MNSYDNFIDDYAVELRNAISDFKKLDVFKMSEEDVDKAFARVDNIYDVGVADKMVDFLHKPKTLTIRAIADMAHKNMNRYGTEMKMGLNALEDFVDALRNFLPEEDED